MKAQKIKFKNLNKDYSILIGSNILKILSLKIKPLCPQTKKIALIFDKGIPPIYKKKILNSLKKYETINLSFNASEKAKSLKSVNFFLNKLLSKNFNRSDLIIGIGGGITGDLSGFAASIFKRGINFISIPTTLLSQVDAAVGGKTGVNSSFGKNLIGSFSQPKLVISDTSFLKSLTRKEMVCGYAEILKHAVINDKKFFNWLKLNTKYIFSHHSKKLIYAIKKSCNIKLFFVNKDVNEKNLRMILNFGHTFAHAIEVKNNYSKNITHGEAVLAGMILATKLSVTKKVCNRKTLNELMKIYKENDLSLNLAAISLFVLWIPPLLFSHVRIIGFDLTRGMLVYTQIETLDLAIWCAIGVGFSAGLATLIRIGEFDLKRIGIHAMTFASLPILMVQQSNNVDWIVIGIVLLVLIIGIYQIMTFGKDTERLVITSALAWMTMSWGVWGGSICLIGFASTERLLAGPWSSILEKRSDIRQETARIVMLALLPLTIWYGIWWTLGQVEGLSWDFLYPREIDPGDILLRGGYIGDRWSPSNEWVAFMGAGPVIAVMLVMWRTFHRVGWPLHLLAAALIIRFSFMWLHLSYAADSPRLVFKATWDAFYGIILVLTLTPFVIYQLLRPSSKNSVETVEDE